MPADTFRAWERRYGLPAPMRTEGNQRLYSERDIAIIDWLRDQTKAGLTISQAIALHRVQEADQRGSDAAEPTATSVPGGALQGARGTACRLGEFRDCVVEALTAFDAGTAERVVEEAIALVTVDDVCRQVLEGALIEIGERWRQGKVGVGAEHFATCFVMRKIGALFNLSQPQSGRGSIVAACVEGELHEIGLLLTCLSLSRHGFKVVYLGANLPRVDLVAVVRALRPPLVLLSATTEAALQQLIETIAVLRTPVAGAGASIAIPIVGYGGRVFLDHPELCLGVDGIFLDSDPREMVEQVERALVRAQI